MCYTGDVFECLASENKMTMMDFSEKLKILYKFSYSMNFCVLLVHREWGRKNGTFCVPLVHITCLQADNPKIPNIK